ERKILAMRFSSGSVGLRSRRSFRVGSWDFSVRVSATGVGVGGAGSDPQAETRIIKLIRKSIFKVQFYFLKCFISPSKILNSPDSSKGTENIPTLALPLRR